MATVSLNDTRLKMIELAYAGRLDRTPDGFFVVPTRLFVSKVDIKMPPLPSIAFYEIKNGKKEVIKEADQPYSALALSAKDVIYIKAEDLETLRKFAETQILSSTANENLPIKSRMESLRRSAIMVVEDLFTNPSPENITRSTKVVSSLVYTLMRDPKAYLYLTQLSSHDPYTLQHSVGTSVNAIILGRKLGVKEEEDLIEIGIGGLLHDIGKTKIKREIINKEGPLDELEWEEMKQHSHHGFDLVKNQNDITDKTKRAILEHHEDKLGTGYPMGLKENQVHLFSKIVCVADIYNALTTNRSYSKARTAFEAFQLMREKLSHKIDPNLFRNLVLIYGGKIDDIDEAA